MISKITIKRLGVFSDYFLPCMYMYVKEGRQIDYYVVDYATVWK